MSEEGASRAAAADDQSLDDTLFVIQALLDGEPRTSIAERLGIYHHCSSVLARLGESSDPRVRSRCADLHALLRGKYPEACGSYHDDSGIPGRETSSLIELVMEYVRDVLQVVSDGEETLWPVGTLAQVNNVATELLFWMYDNENAGAYELLRRIQELQRTCAGVPGLQMPSDEVKSDCSQSSSEEGSGEGEGGLEEACVKDSVEEPGGGTESARADDG